MNYYNDNNPEAAAWLRELIKAELIPNGDVDERSIADVNPADLTDYTQCHFFAGIGGWPYALRLAGWPEDAPVWTGSCPCQPFSCAGKQLAEADPRHLWPQFLRLIAECKPPTVFGEQVASKAGRLWLSGVRADLEALGYAVGAADLCAAGVGAPHIRQRLYWVADTERSGRHDGRRASQECAGDFGGPEAPKRSGLQPETSGLCHAGGLADSSSTGLAQRISDGCLQREEVGTPPRQGVECSCAAGRLGDSFGAGRETRDVLPSTAGTRSERASQPSLPGWSNYGLIPCLDGKTRRVEPGVHPLAHGVSGRVGLLRGYGNAIVPQVAAEFVSAFLECNR